MSQKRKKIIVGLSGGVDSSAALILLKKQGFDPIGVSLKYSAWQSPRNKLKENVCCSAESFRIARQICQKLEVPYYIVDQKSEFSQKVINYYLSILKQKKTPNPCVICNRLVKFDKLFDLAKQLGADYLATGHYARIKKGRRGDYQLLRAKDRQKDQSYFLCLLNQKQLSRIIFPLGEYRKKQVYQLVSRAGFDYFDKVKQSQDLCFVASQSIPSFLESNLGKEPGEIVDQQGNFLGRHQGLHFYTIGQRKGLNLSGGPWYVAGFNRAKNQLVAVRGENNPALFSQKAVGRDCHFISNRAPNRRIKVMAKTRFNQKLAPGYLYPPVRNRILLCFDKPQKAVSPGQWMVFYQAGRRTSQPEICLGGAMIDSVEK